MADFSRSIVKVLAQRATILSIIAVLAALGCTQRNAQAGVILPMVQETAAVEFTALPSESPGSSSAPAEPASDSNRHRDNGDKPAGLVALDGLAETGGASAPVSGAAQSAASVAVAVFDAPARPPVARSFRYLREHRVQLPQPPLGELLDPPKACA